MPHAPPTIAEHQEHILYVSALPITIACDVEILLRILASLPNWGAFSGLLAGSTSSPYDDFLIVNTPTSCAIETELSPFSSLHLHLLRPTPPPQWRRRRFDHLRALLTFITTTCSHFGFN
ncbi:hypothetical protein R3P38DRAFT_3177169 [Favolaschia claudopus]|uniref:Uncharacterized protein n=1 Tax=Favolaschia claudopus TaxID=2862362 RepID=A0AAW0CY73_9AGAR